MKKKKEMTFGEKFNKLVDVVASLEEKNKWLSLKLGEHLEWHGDITWAATEPKQDWCTCKKPWIDTDWSDTHCNNCDKPVQPKEDTKELREKIIDKIKEWEGTYISELALADAILKLLK